MGSLTDFDAVYVAMSFLVPGYVYFVVRGHLVPGHRSRGSESIIRLLSVSTVNLAFWAWAIYLVISTEELPTWTRPAIWTLAVLISPAAMGLVSGLFTRFNILGRIYRKMGFHPVHITPTSWDYAFSRPKPCFIIVKLTDGGRFAGYWGEKSFASDEPSERDIFIEKAFKIDDESGVWTETDRSVLIKASVVRTVEFVDNQGE